MTHYNPEKRAWRGRSYKKGGVQIKDLRETPKMVRCSDCKGSGSKDEKDCQVCCGFGQYEG